MTFRVRLPCTLVYVYTKVFVNFGVLSVEPWFNGRYTVVHSVEPRFNGRYTSVHRCLWPTEPVVAKPMPRMDSFLPRWDRH